MSAARAHIGTSGWNYKHWRNDIYPAKTPQRLWLDFITKHFDTVEVNTTFYRIPKPETVAAWLNQGRQLAIRGNQSLCADIDGAGMHYHIANCAGTIWVGAGTTAAGYVPFPAGVTMSVGAPAIFTYLGAATPAATYTITPTASGRTITVTVSSTGRISIP